MIQLNEVKLSRGTKVLLEKATINLLDKQKIGLVGENGCGKSSLFALLRREIIPDLGVCALPPKLRISSLSQTLPEGDDAALDFVLGGDDEYVVLQQRLKQAEDTGDNDEIMACHESLKQTQGYSKPALAASMMAGLGFKPGEERMSLSSFSGGWRMRLSLARCLMKPADWLLLDEPTNHLDIEAIFWLERWLRTYPGSILLVSHDREFLDAFATHILHMHHQMLTLYTGNYTRFEHTRAQQLMLQQAQYEKQQGQISHMMSYVQRFRAKASKSKQAQSRLKMIANMDVIMQAQMEDAFSFAFYPCSRVSSPLIRCDQITLGYEKPILERVNFTLNPGDRIALLGRNGEGKSTLIKAITGLLAPLAGKIERAQHLSIGYYAQHQLEDLDDDLSPVQTIQALTPEAREQVIRDFLGGFNFLGEQALSPIRHFSGGEKARLALAKLVWLKPNLLLLDEPTNHLDLNMRSAVEVGLQSYEGALILISHDRHLLRTAADEFYLVSAGQVQPFSGDLDDYYQWLQQKEKTTTKPSSVHIKDHKEKKSLQNQLKKLEGSMADYQRSLTTIEHQLADSELYEASQQARLQQLIAAREKVQTDLLQAEETWLDVMNNLESFGAN